MFSRKKTVFRLGTSACLLVGLASLAGAQDRNTPFARVEAGLDSVAKELSIMLADVNARGHLATQFKEAPRKNVLVLREFIGGAMIASRDDATRSGKLLDLASIVQSSEVDMTKCGMPAGRMEIKVPVREHLANLQSSETIYVACAPLADESEVTSIVAYSNGERISLSAAEPPKIPTLVVVPAEQASAEPTYPLTFSAETAPEENPGRVVDDWVGLPWIRITNDHESWVCGDPEIYVKIRRWHLPSCHIHTSTVNLPGVNDEFVWYYLGDPNSTYKYVSLTSYIQNIRFEVWEADSGSHGADDHVGTINVTWVNLPFGGYTTRSSGDVSVQIDRD